jgi:hypothetical protein
MWVLEVVRFIDDQYEHIGYMKAMFRRKKDAMMYYRDHNPHMREIAKCPTSKVYYSDWDPETKLAYIIRKFCRVALTVDPFTPINVN